MFRQNVAEDERAQLRQERRVWRGQPALDGVVVQRPRLGDVLEPGESVIPVLEHLGVGVGHVMRRHRLAVVPAGSPVQVKDIAPAAIQNVPALGQVRVDIPPVEHIQHDQPAEDIVGREIPARPGVVAIDLVERLRIVRDRDDDVAVRGRLRHPESLSRA